MCLIFSYRIKKLNGVNEMVSKSQANKAIKVLQELKALKDKANLVTDSIVISDDNNGTDDMQTSFWQNFQYIFDSIDEEGFQDCINEAKSFYGK